MPTEIVSSPLARNVGVVSRQTDTGGFGSSTREVAQVAR